MAEHRERVGRKMAAKISKRITPILLDLGVSNVNAEERTIAFGSGFTPKSGKRQDMKYAKTKVQGVTHG